LVTQAIKRLGLTFPKPIGATQAFLWLGLPVKRLTLSKKPKGFLKERQQGFLKGATQAFLWLGLPEGLGS